MLSSHSIGLALPNTLYSQRSSMCIAFLLQVGPYSVGTTSVLRVMNVELNMKTRINHSKLQEAYKH